MENNTNPELGFYPGIRYLAEQNYIQGPVFCMDGVITPLIPIGTSGDLNVIIEIIGKSCHSGYNFLGINAIEETLPIMNELNYTHRLQQLKLNHIRTCEEMYGSSLNAVQKLSAKI